MQSQDDVNAGVEYSRLYEIRNSSKLWVIENSIDFNGNPKFRRQNIFIDEKEINFSMSETSPEAKFEDVLRRNLTNSTTIYNFRNARKL
jgi:hypothetical protein